MNAGRIVIGGASGFMGHYLQEYFRAAGREVVTVSRSGPGLHWEDQDGINAAVDGSALVLGLAGKSVNCRYTPKNRLEIFSSRLLTTAILDEAVASAATPPPLWINSSTATIYRHAMDRPMTESGGEIGTGFSVEVAKAWEEALFARQLPNTRKVALRSAIVIGDGGVLATLKQLTKFGLGGPQYDGWWPVTSGRKKAGTAHYPGAAKGTQKFSWVHVADVARMIEFLEHTPHLSGPINAAAPNPVDNQTLMRSVRNAMDIKFGPPLSRWMLELGALGIRTETELILKSRWAVPQKLSDAGFEFQYPSLDAAIAQTL